MSLEKYRAKRHFNRTPEPKGKAKSQRGALRFVVQKHQATRLHYDFRLELGGTLKSWAVPKGPSMNPGDKRLAIQVEDHPLEYRTFEGIIPEGNYGAGTVIIWDEGTYRASETTDRAAGEKLLQQELERGDLRFVLEGKKLRGEFALVKMKKSKGKGNPWLLIKKRDRFAGENQAADEDRSVVSNRTLAEIAGQPAGKRAVSRSRPRTAKLNLADAPKAEMPHNIKPMLATLVEKPFDRPGWVFEIKWDGYRAIAEVDRRAVRLYSRRQLSFEDRFAPIVQALEKLGHDAVLDGEVVVLDDTGKSGFQLLQNYQKTGKGRLAYCVFDLLYADGHDLRELPLLRRKEVLASILGRLPNVQLSDHIEERGEAFFAAVLERGLEGIIAKEANSPYREGRRSRSWLKIKTHQRQEAVIGGFTAPRGSRAHFGALVLGIYEGDDLVYIGHTGTGFTDQTLADVRDKLRPLIQPTCPFKKRPKTNAPVHWVEPKLVCEVGFGEWTGDGLMRHPVFLGLREDKAPETVRREKAKPVEAVLRDGQATPSKPAKRKPRRLDPLPAGKEPVNLNIAGKSVRLTNLHKLYWPEEGYTKGDLIAYYREVAEVILPYLKDRPQSLHRHPNGINGQSFFQKNLGSQPFPDWIQTIDIPSESDGRTIQYALCQDEATLLYLANLGCIELNPWHSRTGSLDQPDYLLMDLDPEDVPFDKIVETARTVRKVLNQAGADGYCKTSGKRGLHIYVPLAARYTHEQAKQFAELVAHLAHRELPRLTSIARMPAHRQQRIYLDYLQNGKGKTLAAPYAARPYPGATVSTPLKWTELRRGLDPAKFTIKTMAKRLDKVGDLWQGVLGQGIDLEKCIERLKK